MFRSSGRETCHPARILVPGKPSINACQIKGINTQTHLTGQPGSLLAPVTPPLLLLKAC